MLERSYLYGTPSLVPNLDVALIASEVTLIALTSALVVAEWRYSQLRWPFTLMLGYYLTMLFTQDLMAQSQWFTTLALDYANL